MSEDKLQSQFTIKLGKPVGDYSRFDVASLQQAQQAILPANSLTTNERWVQETGLLVEKIAEHCALDESSVVLDFGCGVGRVARELIQQFGAVVIGVDTSASMRRLAHEYVQSDRFSCLSFETYQALANESSLRVSVVIASRVLQICSDPEANLALLERWLEPGGSLVVFDQPIRQVPIANGFIDDGKDIWKLVREQSSFQSEEVDLPPAIANVVAEDSARLLIGKKMTGKAILEFGVSQMKVDPDRATSIFTGLLESASPESIPYQDALNNLGVMSVVDNPQAATRYFAQVVVLSPGNARYLGNYAKALFDSGRFEEANLYLAKLLEIEPDNMDARVRKANCEYRMADFDAAESRLESVFVEGYTSLLSKSTMALIHMNRLWFDKARVAFEEIIAQHPEEKAAGELNLGFIDLVEGKFKKGFERYENRFAGGGVKKIDHASSPRWRGESLEGKKLLLIAEQGLGDVFLALRYLDHLDKLGAEVIIFSSSEGLAEFLEESVVCPVTTDRNIGDIDYHLPMMSLFHELREDFSENRVKFPYMHVNAARAADWHRRLSALPGFKVGINWKGNAAFANDRWRSTSLANFGGLADLKGVTLVSLQKGESLQQLEAFKRRRELVDPEERWPGIDRDLAETAALMTNMDLVITTCTSIANLSGALNIPTWILLGYSADWRWFLDREDSVLFPSVRLFRQKKLGEWAEVFSRVELELEKLVG